MKKHGKGKSGEKAQKYRGDFSKKKLDYLKRALFAKIPIYAELQNLVTCHPWYVNIRSDFSARYFELLDFRCCTPYFLTFCTGVFKTNYYVWIPNFTENQMVHVFRDYNAPLQSQNGEHTTEKTVFKKFWLVFYG